MRWIAVLLIATSLAGCIGAEKETLDPADTKDPTTPGTNLGNATAVKAILGLDVALGPAPLAVNMSISVPGYPGSSWNLTSLLDGNITQIASGNSTPAAANHTFDIGNHTLRLTVTTPDGKTATAERMVSALGPEPPAVPEPLADNLQVLKLEGTMAANLNPTTARELQTFEIVVPEGTQAITLWTAWESTPIGLQTPLAADLDVFLRDPSGTAVVSRESTDFEYAHYTEPLEAGTWTVEILGFSVLEDTLYTVEVLLWSTLPQMMQAAGSFVVAENIEGPTVGDAPVLHNIPVPAGATAIAGRLAWSNTEPIGSPDSPCSRTDRLHDLDFGAALDTYTFSSGTFAGCEFGYLDADTDIGGVWQFTVTPYAAAAIDYVLTVYYA